MTYHVLHLWGEIPLVAIFSRNLIGRLLTQWREIEWIIGSLSIKIRLDNFQAWKVVKTTRKKRWRRPFEWTVHGHVIGHMTTSLIRIGTFFFWHILARRRDSVRGCLLTSGILSTLMTVLRNLNQSNTKFFRSFSAKKVQKVWTSAAIWPLDWFNGAILIKLPKWVVQWWPCVCFIQ